MRPPQFASKVVGANARLARLKRGWSQRDLVRALDDRVSQPTISRLESGFITVDVEAIVAISDALNVSPSSLLRGIR